MTGHWRELDHTADLAIQVYGSDLEELFTVSAQGLFALAFEPGSRQATRQFTVKLSAPDVETLLIDWLNELLYLSEKHNAFFSGFNFHAINTTSLSAGVEAVSIHSIKQYIKAATFHNIVITQQSDGFHTEVVFDI